MCQTATPNTGECVMGINLVKGQKVNIGLMKVGVGLGWDPNQSGSGHEYDLDASAFMLDSRKKLLSETYFVYYNNPASPDGAVASSGDDTTGGSSDGDDETLTVDIAKVNPQVEEIVFVVSIYEYDVRKQNFGQVRNSFIRIYDATTNEEICKYELGEDFSIESCIEFGRLYRREGQWRFEAMGIGYNGGLQTVVSKYAS
jgi:tellurium resistance protein TerD